MRTREANDASPHRSVHHSPAADFLSQRLFTRNMKLARWLMSPIIRKMFILTRCLLGERRKQDVAFVLLQSQRRLGAQ